MSLNYRQAVGEAMLIPNTRAEVSQKSIDLIHRYVSEKIVVKRFPVPDDKVSWNVEYPEYKPPVFNYPYGSLTREDQGEIEFMPRINCDYESWETCALCYDNDGRPMHPVGRTGIKGVLTMNKFGPTKAADALVFRDGAFNKRDLLVVRRKDNGLISLPAGKLNPNESAIDACARETLEETGLEFGFGGSAIFKGVVDDSRATDNAWFETAAYVHEASDDEARVLPVGADDAVEALWMPVQKVLEQRTHASTAMILRIALKEMSQ